MNKKHNKPEEKCEHANTVGEAYFYINNEPWLAVHCLDCDDMFISKGTLRNYEDMK